MGTYTLDLCIQPVLYLICMFSTQRFGPITLLLKATKARIEIGSFAGTTWNLILYWSANIGKLGNCYRI